MTLSGIGQPADSPVSRSAMIIVTASAVVSKDPVYAMTFRDPYAELFATAISPEAKTVLDSLDDASARADFIAKSEIDMIGLVTHVLYRKTWIEDQVRAALAAGMRQLVIFGAGCDTLSLRLGDALDGVTVFEIDRPEIVAFRQHVLAGHAEQLAGVHMIEIDFETQTLEALVDGGFDPELATVFVAEGVMEYLTVEEVDALIGFVTSRAPTGSRLAFTFIAGESLDDGSLDTLKAKLDEGGEPLKFRLDPNRIDQFLAARRLRRRDMITPEWVREVFAPRLGAPVDPIAGWYMVAAESTG